jgi:hypothetical protein
LAFLAVRETVWDTKCPELGIPSHPLSGLLGSVRYAAVTFVAAWSKVMDLDRFDLR